MPTSKSAEKALSLIENDNSKILGLTLGTQKVTPGQVIPRTNAEAAPKIAFNLTAGTYIIVCLDIDAPFQSFNFLSPILHWIQPGLRPEQSADGTATLTSSGTPFIANYIGPGPPPGAAPHRYVFMLYEQPADFDGKKYAPAGGKNLASWPRMRYNLEVFEKEASLGPVIAVNYFCSN